jgi:glycosyltransferase involved in cell wall biosynthesis
MKKIVIIMPTLGGGGAERVILNFVNNFDKAKYSTSILLFDNVIAYPDQIGNDIEIVLMGKNLNFFCRILKTISIVKSADVIIGGLELTATYYAVLLGKLFQKKVIGWIHTSLKEYIQKVGSKHILLVHLFYPFVDHFITVSNGVKEGLQKDFKLFTNKPIRTIYNCIDINSITRKSIETVPFDFKLPTIISCGRMDQPKGFDILIEATNILLKKGMVFSLIILGDGPDLKKLKNIASTLGVIDFIHFPGFQSNPYAWFKKSDVFVLSSRYEGFGMVLIEAMAVGTPVISTNCQYGPAEILCNGEYGVLVPPEDPQILAQSIENLLNNPTQRNMLSQKALQRANDFRPTESIQKFELLIDSILKS